MAGEERVITFLREWSIRYIRNRDVLDKQIVELKEFNNNVFVRYKTKNSLYVIEPFIESFSKTLQKGQDLIKELIKESGSGVNLKNEIIIIMFNTQRNLERTIAEWKLLSQIKELKLFFVNPFSAADERWILAPHIHNIIGDEKSISRGLKSMFEMVEQLTPKQVEALIEKERDQ